MLSKFLEKKVEVILDKGSKPVDSLELEYYLLESINTEDEEEANQKTYGVEIIEKYQGTLNDSKKYGNIFNNREKTKSLVDVLAANTVTPVTLPYILDDLLGQ